MAKTRGTIVERIAEVEGVLDTLLDNLETFDEKVEERFGNSESGNAELHTRMAENRTNIKVSMKAAARKFQKIENRLDELERPVRFRLWKWIRGVFDFEARRARREERRIRKSVVSLAGGVAASSVVSLPKPAKEDK